MVSDSQQPFGFSKPRMSPSGNVPKFLTGKVPGRILQDNYEQKWKGRSATKQAEIVVYRVFYI